jgi:hypothetical protein
MKLKKIKNFVMITFVILGIFLPIFTGVTPTGADTKTMTTVKVNVSSVVVSSGIGTCANVNVDINYKWKRVHNNYWGTYSVDGQYGNAGAEHFSLGGVTNTGGTISNTAYSSKIFALDGKMGVWISIAYSRQQWWGCDGNFNSNPNNPTNWFSIAEHGNTWSFTKYYESGSINVTLSASEN